MRRAAFLAVLLLFGVSTSCDEPVAPADGRPGLEAPEVVHQYGLTGECPIPPTQVVTSEAELQAALADAEAGDVIGVDGVVPVGELNVVADGVTLTCATPGSGLVIGTYFQVEGDDVTVAHLDIDGSAVAWAFLVLDAEDIAVLQNRFVCGTLTCLYANYTENGVVEANEFIANQEVISGIHLQHFEDQVEGDVFHVVGNRIETTVPSTQEHMGAVRINNWARVEVRDNLIKGPWANGLGISAMEQSVIEGNTIVAPTYWGIGAGPEGTLHIWDTGIRNNTITGAGAGGVHISDGCYTGILDNDLSGNADDLGILLGEETGGFQYTEGDYEIIDLGNRDCNGDGVADPNGVGGKIQWAQLRFEFGFLESGEQVFHGIGGVIDVRGDFGEVGPEDVVIRAEDGTELTFEVVEIVEKGPYDRSAIGFWGHFHGAFPPLGAYEVTVTDDHGETSEPYQVGALEDYPDDAPTLLYPGADELIEESEPTFRWEPYELVYGDRTELPEAYGIALWRDDHEWAREMIGIPGDLTSIDYRNDYWWPDQPEPLEPGIYQTEFWGGYQVEERIRVLSMRHATFYVPPPTLILHPQDHVTTDACPVYPDYIVQDGLALDIALAIAEPGEVIGVDGVIEFVDTEEWVNVHLATDGLTLTCATPGSGFRPGPGYAAGNLIAIDGVDVTVSHLVIDGSGVTNNAIGSRNYGEDGFRAVGSRIVDNEIICGPWFCLFLIGNEGAVVANNEMVYTGGAGAVQLQGYGPRDENGDQAYPNDGARVVDNVIRADVPSYDGWSLGAGIRIRDGNGVVVSGNEITGPFPNAITVANVKGGAFEHNRGAGAELFGFVLDAMPDNERSTGLVLKNNRFTDAGVAGAYVENACDNTFIGNVLNGNDVGLIFDLRTGANAYAGNGRIVQDDGDLDCDGDGVVDPNLVTGAGGTLKGARFGQRIRDAIAALKVLEGGEVR